MCRVAFLLPNCVPEKKFYLIAWKLSLKVVMLMSLKFRVLSDHLNHSKDILREGDNHSNSSGYSSKPVQN